MLLSGPSPTHSASLHTSHAASRPAVRPDLAPGYEAWYGAYFGGSKIGFAHLTTGDTTVRGRRAVRVEMQFSTQIILLGHEVSQDIDQVDSVFTNGDPALTEFTERSAGHVSHVSATYTPHSIACVIDSSGEISNKTVPIPNGVKLGSGSDFTLSPTVLRLGGHWSEDYFNPATLALEKMTSRVIGPVPHAGTSGSRLWQVEGRTSSGIVQLSVTEAGEVVRVTMPLGIVVVKEPRETACAAGIYHPGPDLAEVGAVVSDARIDHPREVTELHVILSGVPTETSLPSGDGQQAQRTPSGAWDVTITRTKPSLDQVSLPEASPAEFLASTPEINASSPEIVSTARHILAGESSATKGIILLRNWVNTHMRVRYDIGVLRSGLDILHQPEGVCRDYAVLYASMARAAGIPTRICSGIVLWQGKFYYHAWAESFAEHWVRVDPTMSQETADATHIALARGDARSMYQIAGVVGSIKLHVLKVKD